MGKHRASGLTDARETIKPADIGATGHRQWSNQTADGQPVRHPQTGNADGTRRG